MEIHCLGHPLYLVCLKEYDACMSGDRLNIYVFASTVVTIAYVGSFFVSIYFMSFREQERSLYELLTTVYASLVRTGFEPTTSPELYHCATDALCISSLFSQGENCHK